MAQLKPMLLLLLIFHEGVLVLANGQIVNTTSGMIMGVRTQKTDSGLNVTAYMGIPYAEPPVGQLRFAKPVPKIPWEGIFNAFSFGPACFQQDPDWDGSMDEDCLFLNIFVPNDLVAQRGLLPVMIWIHGGSFTSGTSDNRIDTNIVVRGGVVLVSLSYRLGPLGFLFTGDDAAPGNYGLWDQKLALHWVKDNIENFGGDTQRMTIFGVSAGGFSVIYQAITPLNNRSLFQRVISQSGGAADGITLRGDVCRSIAQKIGKVVGCTSSLSPRVFVECLRRIPATEITNAQNSVPLVHVWPCVDGDFLPDYVENLLSSSQLGQYDLLTGVNSGDGSMFCIDPNGISEDSLRALAIGYFDSIFLLENTEQLADPVIFFYTNGALDDPKANMNAYMKMVGDYVFYASTVSCLHSQYQAARSSNHSTNTYLYYFQMYLEWSFCFDGASHGSETKYVFGEDMFRPGVQEAAQNLSMQMIAYWTNFAKTGDPNSDDLPLWPGWTPDTEDYIILDATISIGQQLARDRMTFWRKYFRGLYKLHVSDPNTCSLGVPARSVTSEEPRPVVVEIRSIKDGKIFGTVTGRVTRADSAMGGMDVAEIMGIPYAHPPLGALRFKPSQEIPLLPTGFKSISKPPACPQPLGRDIWMINLGLNDTDENCLTLNIYAPVVPVGRMPVVVYIHHGYGLHGTASVYDFTTLASKSKSVVVVINYRLGVLGFLSTEDEAAPGNAGLHDIVIALKWVNKYIGSFSGDPSHVTVVGYGTGASLAHILTVSERSKDLFQKAVLMSGSAFSPMITNHPANPADQATALAKQLDCPTCGNIAMITCLQGKSVTDLIENTAVVGPPFTMAFPPVVDGNILVKSPLELIQSGKVNDVGLIIGMTRNEVDDQVARLLQDNLDACPKKADVQDLIDNVVRRLYHNRPDLVSLAVVSEYMGGMEHGQGSCPNRERLRGFLGDVLAAIPTIQAARHHSMTGNTVYLYSFDQDPKYHYGPLPSWADTCFGDDLQYLFGFPYWPDTSFPLKEVPAYRPRDRKAAMEWMTLLSNFINQGSPGQSSSGVVWPPYSALNGTHISFDWCPSITSYSTVDHTYRFWTEVIPALDTIQAQPNMTPQPGPFINGGLGLHLTPSEANTAIKALFGTCISVGVLFLVLVTSFVIMCARTKKSDKTYFGADDSFDNPTKIEIKSF